MVRSIVSLATMALAGLAAATAASEIFSFAQWARDIAENPNGQHLSVDEAISAFQNNTAAVALQSREGEGTWVCNNIPDDLAWVPDAVTCINTLAGKGGQLCEVTTFNTFCRKGDAEIVGTTGGDYQQVACQRVAEIAGGIMDRCYHNDRVLRIP